eukprot:COSAG01_NODE_5851_length_3993_cov_9.227273_1_plen_57_part_00
MGLLVLLVHFKRQPRSTFLACMLRLPLLPLLASQLLLLFQFRIQTTTRFDSSSAAC